MPNVLPSTAPVSPVSPVSADDSAVAHDFASPPKSDDEQTLSPVASHVADPLVITALAKTLPSFREVPARSTPPLEGARPGDGNGSGEHAPGKTQSTETSIDTERPPPAEIEGYQIKKLLGRGAYGTVWLAEQKNTGKQVAIKFYAHADGLDLHLLRREVESLAFLYTERDVVQLLAVGWDHKPPYYVMEYLPHGSLEERLRNGPLPIADAVRVAKVVARALGRAHGRGILHCDLKPANVLLDGSGKPRLCDFGQARLGADQKPSLGTFFYMAPEQADLLAVPDARWDVYGLGAMLYAMLTGGPPYRDGPLQTLLRRANSLPERLRIYRQFLACSSPPDLRLHRRAVDTELREIVARCLATDPAQRYPNVQAVLGALDRRTKHEQRRPVFLLGALGPALLMVMTALIAFKGVRVAMKSSNDAVTQRARESSEFAARFVAETAGREIDRRWNVLEQAALDVQLRTELAQATGQPTEPRPVLQKLVSTLGQRNQSLAAASWFVTTARGVQVARHPRSSTIGQSWAFRDYFHGRGLDLPRNTSPQSIAPITKPHRSAVFLSEATNRRLVAFSVPIWSPQTPSQVIGVLGMTVELGGFGELRPGPDSSERQIAVLVDGRKDWTGQKGLILQHPRLAALLARGQPLPMIRLSQDHLQTIEVVKDCLQKGLPLPTQTLFQPRYDDPASEVAGPWLMTMRPVLARGLDTGWLVLVQERVTDVTKPVADLGASLFRIGWVGLLMMALVWLALWWQVNRGKTYCGGR